MTSSDILAAADSAATWCAVHSMRDALACYMLVAVGHLRFEDVARELELEGRREVLSNFNAISVARLTGDQKISKAVQMAARLAQERSS